MDNISVLEECYKKFVGNLSDSLPEGFIEVNLKLLHQLELLSYAQREANDPNLTRYFHVIETEEKITLINNDFIIWIVPDFMSDAPGTYTFIALNQPAGPKLEMAYVTSGIYNSSKLVLRVLEKELKEIQENEELVGKLR